MKDWDRIESKDPEEKTNREIWKLERWLYHVCVCGVNNKHVFWNVREKYWSSLLDGYKTRSVLNNFYKKICKYGKENRRHVFNNPRVDKYYIRTASIMSYIYF